MLYIAWVSSTHLLGTIFSISYINTFSAAWTIHLLLPIAGNMDETIEYYKKHFGLKQLRYRDIPEVCMHLCPPLLLPCCMACTESVSMHPRPRVSCACVQGASDLKSSFSDRHSAVLQEKYTNAFLGAGPEETHFALELTYNYGVDHYDIGTGFGHFALAHPDVYKLVESIKKDGKWQLAVCCLPVLANFQMQAVLQLTHS